MSQSVIFIDEIYLKENSPITNNVDTAEIYPFVLQAQERWIQEALGTSLYNYLIAQGKESPAWPKEEDNTLIEMVRKALVWYTVYDFIPFNWIKIRNTGLVSQSGDNMGVASDTQMQYVRNEAKDKAIWHINRVIEYLCENSSKYSEYNKNCWSCGNVGPLQNKVSHIDLAFDRTLTPEQNFYKKYLS